MTRSDYHLISELYINATNTQPTAPQQPQSQAPIGATNSSDDDTPELTQALAALTATMEKYKTDPKKSASAMKKLQQTFGIQQPTGQAARPAMPQNAVGMVS